MFSIRRTDVCEDCRCRLEYRRLGSNRCSASCQLFLNSNRVNRKLNPMRPAPLVIVRCLTECRKKIDCCEVGTGVGILAPTVERSACVNAVALHLEAALFPFIRSAFPLIASAPTTRAISMCLPRCEASPRFLCEIFLPSSATGKRLSCTAATG
jgi:hypothetical protein